MGLNCGFDHRVRCCFNCWKLFFHSPTTPNNIQLGVQTQLSQHFFVGLHLTPLLSLFAQDWLMNLVLVPGHILPPQPSRSVPVRKQSSDFNPLKQFAMLGEYAFNQDKIATFPFDWGKLLQSSLSSSADTVKRLAFNRSEMQEGAFLEDSEKELVNALEGRFGVTVRGGTLNKLSRTGYSSHQLIQPFHLGYTNVEVDVLLLLVGRIIRILFHSYDFVPLASSEFNSLHLFLMQWLMGLTLRIITVGRKSRFEFISFCHRYNWSCDPNKLGEVTLKSLDRTVNFNLNLLTICHLIVFVSVSSLHWQS